MNRFEFNSNLINFKNKQDELAHYGTRGQKWGVRKWQNYDGTFNEAGKERYFGKKSSDSSEKMGGYSDLNNKFIRSQAKFAVKHPKLFGVEGLTEEEVYQAYKNVSLFRPGDVTPHDQRRANINAMKAMKLAQEVVKPNEENFGSYGPKKSGSINWKQLDESNHDSYGKSDEQYWKDKAKTEKYLDENYDKDFAQVMKDTYDTTGEWGDIDAAYEQFKENPYEYLKKYSRDPKYNLSPKEEKALQKEAKKLEKEVMNKNGDYEYANGNKVEEWLNKDENKEIVDNYMNTYDKHFNKTSKELKEVFKDYDEDENGYVSKAGLYEAIESGDTDLLNLFGIMHWFLGDDGDQGSRNSKSYYLQDKGNSMSDIISLYTRFDESQNIAQHESLVTLEKEPIYNHLNDKIQRSIANRLYWMYNEKNDYVNSKMEDAVQGMPRDNKIVNEVNKISKKLSPSCGDKDSNGWWYVTKAIENLNLESLDYKDLTDADWNRINDEVNKLKK